MPVTDIITPPTTVAKVLRLRVSVGTDNSEKFAEFEARMKQALLDAGAKNVTSLGGEYIVDGQVVTPDDHESPKPKQEPKKAEAKKDERPKLQPPVPTPREEAQAVQAAEAAAFSDILEKPEHRERVEMMKSKGFDLDQIRETLHGLESLHQSASKALTEGENA